VRVARFNPKRIAVPTKGAPMIYVLASLGNGFYRMMTVLAIIVAGIVVIAFFSSMANGDPYVQIVALLVAGVIWLVGRAGKLVLAGH
jgi:hypothetical protein